MTTNPFKRLRELTLTSQKDFAAKYNLSKTMMTYIESGQVANLSERMIVSLGQECAERQVDARQVLKDEYNAQTLSQAFDTWKSNERMANAHLFQQPLTGNETWAKSPFQVYIEDVTGTQQKFCKALKVPASAVSLYANGQILTMPKAIEDALTQVQFRYIPELKELQSKWIGKAA